jgi:hypothetical protein
VGGALNFMEDSKSFLIRNGKVRDSFSRVSSPFQMMAASVRKWDPIRIVTGSANKKTKNNNPDSSFPIKILKESGLFEDVFSHAAFLCFGSRKQANELPEAKIEVVNDLLIEASFLILAEEDNNPLLKHENNIRRKFVVALNKINELGD